MRPRQVSRGETKLAAVTHELVVLLLMGAVMIPLGLYVFGLVERWAKRMAKLKRTG